MWASISREEFRMEIGISKANTDFFLGDGIILKLDCGNDYTVP